MIITIVISACLRASWRRRLCLFPLVNESRLDLRFMHNLERFAKAQTHTTSNEAHVFDMRGEINSAPLTKYLDSGINEACMDQPTQTQLTQ